MIIQMVHFTFAPDDGDKAAAMFRELREKSRGEAGVVTFDVGQSPEHPGIFALWEVYRDQAAFDSHKNTEHFQRLVVNGVRPLAKERSGNILAPI
jgi:autoinducer 2-degrading protein